MKLFWKIMCLVYVYYTHPGYQTSICGKNRAYYIRILRVNTPLQAVHNITDYSITINNIHSLL